MPEAAIAGYTYGSAEASPVTMEELSLLRASLRASVLFGSGDEAALREAGTILSGQVEQVLDVWYGFVGDNPQLLAHFSSLDGEPIGDYLAGVRGRFGQWIRDTCERPYDETRPSYQHEIALRHTPAHRNLTDGVSSTPHVPLRYLIALIYPITATIRPFLSVDGISAERVEALHEAWRKSSGDATRPPASNAAGRSDRLAADRRPGTGRSRAPHAAARRGCRARALPDPGAAADAPGHRGPARSGAGQAGRLVRRLPSHGQ